MGLMFSSSRRGYDEAADLFRKKDEPCGSSRACVPWQKQTRNRPAWISRRATFKAARKNYPRVSSESAKGRSTKTWAGKTTMADN